MSANDPNPRLRRDAELNRDRIVAAAQEAYANEGLGVSMASVARRAGVGIATLFRRFRCSDELIATVFADRMNAYLDALRTALADSDPWHGFTGFVRTSCEMQVADRGFADVLTRSFPSARAFEASRSEAYASSAELIDRVRRTGKLRTDLVPEDLTLLLMANAGVIAAAGEAAPEASRRVVDFLIQAYGITDPDPVSPAPDTDELCRAMAESRRSPRTH